MRLTIKAGAYINYYHANKLHYKGNYVIIVEKLTHCEKHTILKLEHISFIEIEKK